MKDIKVGSYVRSFDFEPREGRPQDCYIEGTVIGFMEREGCQRYLIRSEKRVWGGKEIALHEAEREVCPPVNGTIMASTGKPMELVELLK